MLYEFRLMSAFNGDCTDVNQWIHIRDRRPKLDIEKVLISNSEGNMAVAHLECLHGRDFAWNICYEYFPQIEIYPYWMPLPEKPTSCVIRTVFYRLTRLSV
jgi:hypothetical protein